MVEKKKPTSTGGSSKKGQKPKRKTLGEKKRSRADQNINPAQQVLANNDQSLIKRTDFLRCLYNGMTASKACREVNIARSWVYALRDADQGFRDLWDKALVEGQLYRRELLEETITDRAVNGFKEETIEYNIGMIDGQFVEMPVRKVTKKRQDPATLLKVLQAEHPDKWNPAHKVDGKIGLSDDLTDMIKRVQEDEGTGLDSLVSK